MKPDTTSNALAEKIRAEILRGGPLAFSRFMELALYSPGEGYYRRDRSADTADPFGRSGDFFTAEQLQPVFGRLIGAAIADLRLELKEPEDFTVVELGAGREEMAEAFSGFAYVPIDVDRGILPDRMSGVIFSNEFFDALPVDVAVREGSTWRERRVAIKGDRFQWIAGPAVDSRSAEYLARWAAPEQNVVELHHRGVDWMQNIAARLERGYVLTIDYGYTRREALRFPEGTLMSYRRHVASEHVLEDAGNRDITSHVPFSILEEAGRDAGLETVRLETLASFLLRLGEERFEQAIAGGHAMQLKTLLFGLGETFRVLLQRRARTK